MKRRDRSIAALGGALALAVSLAGCPAPARRPAPAPPGGPPGALPAPAAPPAPAGPGAAEEDRARVLAQVARDVRGVRQAWVVTAGRTAYVGIDVDAAGARAPGRNAEIERAVGDRVRRANLGIDRVYVTTRPELVQSIMNIEQAVGAGRPVSTFAAELARLAAEIAPTPSP
ncbi:YhcN/YlaJ family sporulation lipoprotein [Caldinitratiruptor microaerophilus]|uniref:YhcN/YlaJ family sporulation lipoprotein n=1 Tax=Caldinitratiruptor microaerophilus TaxID=671077 RepID=A0AA35CM19_9FIRM|nr:YhcN/YlaJ family sporulation lipoprotein [Caldinitratiruptor microaerophilus]BDG60042.1 hypothetical protein caldi_11320 [Caldinitratiruptor microaerophilus]